MNTAVLTPPTPPAAPVPRQLRPTKRASLPRATVLEAPGAGSAISDRTKLIVARVNVGWGNTVYLRGEGGCLTWDQGVPMICSGDDRWVWACHADEAPRQFKFLRNDLDWALGENEIMTGTDIMVCSPTFPG